MNIIEIKNISLTNKKTNETIYNNLNLNLEHGKLIAIIGKSGTGKTTLFKAITKNIRMSSGSIYLFDKNIYETGKKEWKNIIKRIGILTQNTNLISSRNVYENVKNGIVDYQNIFYSLLLIPSKQQREKIFEILDQLNILDKSFHTVSTLSGGQKQRVEIAKLLIKNVDLILADEPTSNLDYNTSREVVELLVDLNKKYKKTVLVNIHDLDLAIEKFDEVVVINNGKVVIHDRVENVELWRIKQILKQD